MKTRPILFNAAMVRAILDGRKTQTRRVVKPQDSVEDYEGKVIHLHTKDCPGYCDYACGTLSCPYGVPGDRLWVRETFCVDGDDHPVCFYRADYPGVTTAADSCWSSLRWKPSIHMPRSLSRITLEVLSVRVERVQDISARDAWAEGVRCDCTSPVPQCAGNINAFWGPWDTINAKRGYGWAANPWVWVVGFKVVG